MKGAGFGFGLAVFILGLGVAVFYFGDVHGIQTMLADDESAFRPIENLPYARSLAGPGVEFMGFEARFVGPDGTVDLGAEYGGEVEYDFVGGARVVDDRPIGAGGGAAKVRSVTVRATRMGWEPKGRGPKGEQLYDLNLGMRKREYEREAADWLKPSELPTCSMKALWKAAVSKGAPANAVAVVKYAENRYEFMIEGTSFELNFDKGCKPLSGG